MRACGDRSTAEGGGAVRPLLRAIPSCDFVPKHGGSVITAILTRRFSFVIGSGHCHLRGCSGTSGVRPVFSFIRLHCEARGRVRKVRGPRVPKAASLHFSPLGEAEVRKRAVRTRRKPLGVRKMAFKVFHESRDTKHESRLLCFSRDTRHETRGFSPKPPVEPQPYRLPRFWVTKHETRNTNHGFYAFHYPLSTIHCI